MEASRRTRLNEFVNSCWTDGVDFRLTPQAEPTAYARCFGIFTLALIKQHSALETRRADFIEALVSDVRKHRGKSAATPRDKAYRQLLTFTLSAMSIFSAEDDPRLAGLVAEQVPENVIDELEMLGCFSGKAQSGNQAMFLAIFLLHASKYLGINTAQRIDAWVTAHLETMNRFGFWGKSDGATHLHFQNGYHQYEILEFVDVENPRQRSAIDAVRALADQYGHFAPYPGGGGCFDYDAVVVLTPGARIPDESTARLLTLTSKTIGTEQQHNGGFCESLNVRPRLRNWPGFARRLVTSGTNRALFMERLRYALTLQRPKHDCVTTHWSTYQRRWHEADLWDSYFRMLLLARIECAFEPAMSSEWGFISYPGIGWHPSLGNWFSNVKPANPRPAEIQRA